ncbi:MAG: class I SAM-dependent methyltransferase [Erysipelotrichaceae bacterium]|nr:class I SAM-dependent methyltransferase [Erysipelotrichaceae bacterium]
MKARNINEVVHEWLLEICDSNTIAIDATAGNGVDTVFLANICREVIAFDISKQAIENTKKACAQHSNVIILHQSHDQMINFIRTADVAVFNLGYLPKGDKSIVTLPESTLRALNQAQMILGSGYICITCYLGHPGGKDEHRAVLDWLSQHTEIVKSYTYPIEEAPIAYLAKIKDR